jgi:hypothetical protein
LFRCGDFGSALDFLNEWLRQPRTVERADLQSVARVLSLIIHYEMGNTTLLESVLRSTTRYLQKKNRLEALELRFVQFMSELLRTPVGRERTAVLQRAKDDLQQLSEQHEAQAVLDTFRFGGLGREQNFGQNLRRSGTGKGRLTQFPQINLWAVKQNPADFQAQPTDKSVGKPVANSKKEAAE